MKASGRAVLALLTLGCFAIQANADVHRHGHGYYHGGYGARWIAPAVIGGIVGYSIARPAVVYGAPPVIYGPPVAVIGPTVPQSPVYYYCESVQNYYPHARVCPEGWKVLPVVPSQ